MNDHPYAILDAPWVSPPGAPSPRTSCRSCRRPSSRPAFQAAGFRDHAGRPGDAIDPSNGLLPDQPTRDAVDAVRGRARRDPAFLGQTSASARACSWSSTCRGRWGMPRETPGDPKLELAKGAAIQALGPVRARRRGRALDLLQRLRARRCALRGAVAHVAARSQAAGTAAAIEVAASRPAAPALYATVDDAVDVMVGSFDPESHQRHRGADRRQERLRGVLLARPA